ncbi:hypothetical protein SAMN05444266_10290 [Chitinophaga jiangningensis]|uniref:Uncharacterized protein n=1 Tax=Chitinophaga jiangningensis TaxID=1419482 RepID=A0A1M6XZY4_9BACT|nr:hypothetical protein [Chitinophaga jiangningensis]SHL11476.1 hypothetical protein SAMN05444266_10290 [Chitinophaga jiangningensis]
MYYVLFFDFASLENLELVKQLRKSDVLSDILLLHQLEPPLQKETFSTQEEAHQFVNDLADHCALFCIVDADDNFILQSPDCKEMMEKNKAAVNAIQAIRAIQTIFQSTNN